MSIEIKEGLGSSFIVETCWTKPNNWEKKQPILVINVDVKGTLFTIRIFSNHNSLFFQTKNENEKTRFALVNDLQKEFEDTDKLLRLLNPPTQEKITSRTHVVFEETILIIE